MARRTAADWTPEHVVCFWRWHARHAGEGEAYVSRALGKGIASFLRHAGRLRGRVLDYGCGSGHLASELLRAPGTEVYGCDAAPEAVARAAARLSGRPRWGGAVVVGEPPAPYADASFDVVVLIETLEHLAEPLLLPVLRDLRRLVKPGGVLLVTTPHDEDLSRNLTYCPFCDSEFHRVEHVRAFTGDGLASLLAANGFDVLYLSPLDLARFAPRPWTRPGDLSIRILLRGLRWALRRMAFGLLDLLAPRPFPAGRWFRHLARRGPHLVALSTPAPPR